MKRFYIVLINIFYSLVSGRKTFIFTNSTLRSPKLSAAGGQLCSGGFATFGSLSTSIECFDKTDATYTVATEIESAVVDEYFIDGNKRSWKILRQKTGFNMVRTSKEGRLLISLNNTQRTFIDMDVRNDGSFVVLSDISPNLRFSTSLHGEILSYDASGALVQTRTFVAPIDSVDALVVHPSENNTYYVIGTTSVNIFESDFTITGSDPFIVKYSSSATPVVRIWGSSNGADDSITDAKVDAISGRIYVYGTTVTTAKFDGNNAIVPGSRQWWVTTFFLADLTKESTALFASRRVPGYSYTADKVNDVTVINGNGISGLLLIGETQQTYPGYNISIGTDLFVAFVMASSNPVVTVSQYALEAENNIYSVSFYDNSLWVRGDVVSAYASVLAPSSMNTRFVAEIPLPGSSLASLGSWSIISLSPERTIFGQIVGSSSSNPSLVSPVSSFTISTSLQSQIPSPVSAFSSDPASNSGFSETKTSSSKKTTKGQSSSSSNPFLNMSPTASMIVYGIAGVGVMVFISGAVSFIRGRRNQETSDYITTGKPYDETLTVITVGDFASSYNSLMISAFEQQQELEKTLRGLLNPDNNVRVSFENSLNEWLARNPAELLGMLVEFAHSNNHESNLRSFALVLFRRFISMAQQPQKSNFSLSDDNAHIVWNKLSKSARQQLQDGTLRLLASEVADKSLRHKICDVIAQISKYEEEWAMLLSALEECTRHPEAIVRESAYWIISSRPEVICSKDSAESRMEDGRYMLSLPNVNMVAQNFISALQDQSIDVRIAAMKAAVQIITHESLCRKSQQSFLAPILNHMANILPAVASNDEYLIEALTAFIEIAEYIPKTLKPILSQLMVLLIEIIGNPKLDAQIRQTALELAVTLSENAPVMVRKLDPNVLSNLLQVTLEMMTEIDDDLEWHNSTQLEEPDGSETFVVAEQQMDRLSCALGGKFILPPLFVRIPEYLSSEKWNYRHAGLMCLSSIAEGSLDIMSLELAKVVETVVHRLVNDDHPRVRYAACNAIGQFCTDFAPEIQKRFSEPVIKSLCGNMTHEPRVATHAAAALVNFCEGVSSSNMVSQVITPYLPLIIEKMDQLLQIDRIYAKEQAITTLAVVADSSATNFLPYYAMIMPHVLQILQQSNDLDTRVLRGKAIECASLMALAVGKEAFMPHANHLISLMTETQKGAIEPDDPQITYLISAWGRVCRVLGSDFLPFLPTVMTPLIVAASYKPDFAMLEGEDDPSARGLHEEDGWEFMEIDGKKFGIKTVALEEKATACEMLVYYARELKEGFGPWVQSTFDLLLPLLKFYFHEGVRFAAASGIPVLLQCLAKSPDYQLKLNSALSTLLHVISDEEELELTVHFLESLRETIESSGCLLDKQKFESIYPSSTSNTKMSDILLLDYFCDCIIAQAMEVFKRSSERQKQRHDADLYDIEMENVFKEAEQVDDLILGELSRVVNVIFKTHGDHFIPFFDRHFSEWLQGMILSPVNSHETFKTPETESKQWAICIFDDLIEFCSIDACAKYRNIFWKPMTEAILCPHPDIVQASCYGVGTLCVKLNSINNKDVLNSWCPFILQSFQILFVALKQMPQEESFIYARENAISALGKIIEHIFRPCIALGLASTYAIDLQYAVDFWLSMASCSTDEEEAQFIYTTIAMWAREGNPLVAKHRERLVSECVKGAKAFGKDSAATECLMVLTEKLPVETRSHIFSQI